MQKLMSLPVALGRLCREESILWLWKIPGGRKEVPINEGPQPGCLLEWPGEL